MNILSLPAFGALLATLALGPLLGGCGGSPASGARLSESDAGKTVDLGAGERLEIVLAGNPTTGYQWELAEGDSAVIRPAGEPAFQADSGLIGSGGRVTVPFQAVAAGRTKLKLIYHRSFEPGVAPLKTFEVDVVVK